MRIVNCLLIGIIFCLFSCAGSKPRLMFIPSDAQPGTGAPIQLNWVTAEYPQEAREQGITATVRLKVFVDTLGKPSQLVVLNESEENVNLFVESVKEAALKTKWRPAIKDGKPIAVWINYKVNFKEPFDTAPILVKGVTPKYPLEAQQQNITATVWVKVLIDSLGEPSQPIIVNENEEDVYFFADYVKEAALKYKWKPATADGKPIACWVTYKVDFKLH
jgi:TonB family protein